MTASASSFPKIDCERKKLRQPLACPNRRCLATREAEDIPHFTEPDIGSLASFTGLGVLRPSGGANAVAGCWPTCRE